MNNNDYLVLDRTTICADWYRLWSSFGFTEYQWSSRAAKVEEYTQVKSNSNFRRSLFVILTLF
jgi:hypothetical protein